MHVDRCIAAWAWSHAGCAHPGKSIAAGLTHTSTLRGFICHEVPVLLTHKFYPVNALWGGTEIPDSDKQH